jgi:hypothetical protein
MPLGDVTTRHEPSCSVDQCVLAPVDPGKDADGRYWIRCRLTAGSYECPPEIDGIALNAVVVRHDVSLDEEKPP